MSVLEGPIFSQARLRGSLFAGLMLLLIACLAGYLFSDEWVLLLIPFGLLALGWGIMDFRLVYLAIWATIPFAIEIDLPGGLSTDFPAEPFMWLTCLLLPVYLFINYR